MKGQITMLPLLLVFLVIVITAVAIFVSTETSELEVAINDIEFANLQNNLRTRAIEYADLARGNAQTFTFNTPDNLELVCFVSEQHDEFAFPRLEVRRGVEQGNVFFFPNEFGAVTIDEIKPEKTICIDAKNSLNVRMISEGNSIDISSSKIQDEKCTELVSGSGDINIVFMGLGFTDPELTTAALGYIENVFKEIPPFSTNFDQFNFYQLHGEASECRITHYIDCNTYEVMQRASACPHDFIVILANRNTLIDFTNPIRSSAVGNLMKINTADDPEVLAHEFGHTFAGLADEYVEQSYYGQFQLNIDAFPNCDVSPSCEKWEDVDGEGITCVPGCSLQSMNRPTVNSIMNRYWAQDGQEFWAVNERAIKQKFTEYEN